MNISINQVSEELRKQAIEDYKNGKSMRQIERDYQISRASLARFFEKTGLKTVKGNHHRIYFHNEIFFKDIDNEEKAYWLGFMFADGYIVDHANRYGEENFGISIAESDIDHLYKFKEAIQATNPINVYERTGSRGQPLCRLLMTSQRTVDDLIDKGCIKQKSLLLEPPKNVPFNLIHHFIRGFFDGDGSIVRAYHEKRKRYIYSINVTSTYAICKWLQDFFKMGQVAKELRREKTYYYNLGGHDQVETFYKILYADASIYLDRKYDRFKEFLKYR